MFSLLRLMGDAAYAIIPPVAVLVLFALRIALLPERGELDVVAHFLGGFAIAWMTMIVWERWSDRKWIPKMVPRWLRNYTVWGTVGIVGIAWEFMETLVSIYTAYMLQFSIAETMGDLFMALWGGLVFILLYTLFKRGSV